MVRVSLSHEHELEVPYDHTVTPLHQFGTHYHSLFVIQNHRKMFKKSVKSISSSNHRPGSDVEWFIISNYSFGRASGTGYFNWESWHGYSLTTTTTTRPFSGVRHCGLRCTSPQTGRVIWLWRYTTVHSLCWFNTFRIHVVRSGGSSSNIYNDVF